MAYTTVRVRGAHAWHRPARHRLGMARYGQAGTGSARQEGRMVFPEFESLAPTEGMVPSSPNSKHGCKFEAQRLTS